MAEVVGYRITGRTLRDTRVSMEFGTSFKERARLEQSWGSVFRGTIWLLFSDGTKKIMRKYWTGREE